jgi:hypothetical protein
MSRVLGGLAAALVLAAVVAARGDDIPKQSEQKAYTISITGVG